MNCTSNSRRTGGRHWLLLSGPNSEKSANKEVSRVIEIRGDQTLEQLHRAIFDAYDRFDEHPCASQFGKRPFDPDGPNYGVPGPGPGKKGDRDARDKTRRARFEAGSCFRVPFRLRRRMVSSA
jgi:hypothetical protein